MRVALATARALGFASRRARRGRRPCFAEPGAPNPRGPQAGPRTAPAPAGRMSEEFVMSRSQLGAVAMLATQIRAVCSGAGDFSMELEGEGDDDDGT